MADEPIIVVLGAPNHDDGRLGPAAEGRAQAALRAYADRPGARLLLTGGFGAHFNRTSRAHAAYLADHLVAAGVPSAAILGEVHSGNTVEDAAMCAARLSGSGLQLVVVTSDFHAARARLLFEREFGARATIEIVVAPAGLPPRELCEAITHEARAIARLTGSEGG